MPRVKRRGHTQKLAVTTYDKALEAMLADEWGTFDGLESPALAGLPPEEKVRVLTEAMRIEAEEMKKHRDVELRRKMEEGGPRQWAIIFCERPDLERRLSFEQRQQWHSWLRSQGVDMAARKAGGRA